MRLKTTSHDAIFKKVIKIVCTQQQQQRILHETRNNNNATQKKKKGGILSRVTPFLQQKNTKWLQGFNEPTRAFLTHMANKYRGSTVHYYSIPTINTFLFLFHFQKIKKSVHY
jgi:23S rRNA maturation mini-RNase III